MPAKLPRNPLDGRFATKGRHEPRQVAAEHAALLRVRREQAEFDLARDRGKYMERAEAVRIFGEKIFAARARLLPLGAIAAAKIGPTERRAEIQQVIDDLIYDALAELAQGWRPANDAKAKP